VIGTISAVATFAPPLGCQAGAILRLAQLPGGGQGLSSTDADEIVRQVVAGRRQRARGPVDDFCENDKGLPPFERHMEDTWRELQARAAEEVPAARQGTHSPG
jgi:hypothetical protein